MKAMEPNTTTVAKEPHILVIPHPAQGHLIPLLDLSHQLSIRGFAITVAVGAANLPLLDAFLASTPSASPLALDLPPHPSLPSRANHARDLQGGPLHHVFLSLPLASLRPHLLSWARSQMAHNPVSLIISDFFLGWTQLLAEELEIRRVVFNCSGAFAIAAMDQLWAQLPGPTSSHLVQFPTLPTSPSFPYWQIPSVYRRYKENAGNEDWEFIRETFVLNSKSWGAVVNTFDALEVEFVDHLKKSYGHDRVWAVGPLRPTGTVSARGGASAIPAERLNAWLGSCPPASVLYVCFGSQHPMSPAQTEALAAGLEASGVRFIWAPGTAELPNGFEERTAHTGLVIRGWAPQVEILNHVAVVAFLTHCGWNSVLEGVSAGVVLLTWPLTADQFIDAHLLVEGRGAAVRVAEGMEAVPDPKELAKVFKEAVQDGKWSEVRKRAAELGKLALEAVAEAGSSSREFHKMVKVFNAVAEKKE